MAGLTLAGLEIKRLPEVTADLRRQAEQIFADLAPSGDVVDTSVDTTLGRLIGLIAPALASTWEALQDVHNSYSAQNAVGVSLDNMVALAGIARLPQTRTRTHCIFEGDVNTTLTLDAKVASTSTKRIFSLLAPLTLTPTGAIGISVSVAVQNSTLYRVTFNTDGVVDINVDYTSDGTATEAEILTGIQAAIVATHSATFNTSLAGSNLYITSVDPFQPVNFTTSANVVIGKVQHLALVQDDVPGPSIQLAGSVDAIAVPVLGWDSVSNPLPATTGRSVETDPELRERFRVSKFQQSANIIESLIDALKTVDGVTDSIVYENDTDATDGFGVPRKSFMPIVLGGLTTTIAETIWQNKPTGISSHGDTLVNIADSQGLQHSIRFRRPTPIRLYASINISSTGIMAGNVDVLIKEALAKEVLLNNKIGTDLIYSRMYTPINSIPGFQINTFFIGTSPSPSTTANIVVAFNEVAQLAVTDIIVTIT